MELEMVSAVSSLSYDISSWITQYNYSLSYRISPYNCHFLANGSSYMTHQQAIKDIRITTWVPLHNNKINLPMS